MIHVAELYGSGEFKVILFVSLTLCVLSRLDSAAAAFYVEF